jgi:hypothetical protein
MGRINWGRVLLGGIVAGLVLNVSEYILNDVVLREDMQAAMAALGRSGPDAGGNVAVWVLYGFVVGIAAVWLYAAIRPRFGPGAGTAVLAGFAVWVLDYLLGTVAMLNLGLFPRGLLMIGLIWGLVEILIATVAGAWVYREA